MLLKVWVTITLGKAVVAAWTWGSSARTSCCVLEESWRGPWWRACSYSPSRRPRASPRISYFHSFSAKRERLLDSPLFYLVTHKAIKLESRRTEVWQAPTGKLAPRVGLERHPIASQFCTAKTPLSQDTIWERVRKFRHAPLPTQACL